MIRHVLWATALSNCLVGLAGAATIGGARAIALIDQPAPGIAATLDRIGIPSIDPDGNTCFRGDLDSTANRRRGIWVGRPDEMQLAAVEGQFAPGTESGVTFSSLFFSEPQLRAGGQLGIYAVIDGPGVTSGNGDGVWIGTTDGLALAARAGSPAPGTSSTYDKLLFADIATAANGQWAFKGLITDLRGDSIWAGTPGALELAAQVGARAPGRSNTFTSISAPNVNSHGQISFSSHLSSLVDGIWYGRPGTLQMIGTGDAAPDAGAGVTFRNIFSHFSPPTFNERGQVAFQASLSNSAIDRSLWVGGADGKHLIAATNRAVPGYPAGARYFVFDHPRLNDLGQIAFTSQITGEGTVGVEYALFIGSSTQDLRLVARKGQQAPQLPLGVVFSDFGEYSINDRGAVAFSAHLTGPGIVAGQNDYGIWAANAAGQIFPAVRLGDQIETLSGVFRTITSLDWAAQDPTFDAAELFSPFNARGELVFQAGLGGFDAGNFLITVPEPSTMLLGLLGIVGAWAARRRFAAGVAAREQRATTPQRQA